MLTGKVTCDQIGITVQQEDGFITLTEPFNHTAVRTDGEGLYAINVIVSEHRLHILGHYSIETLSDLCCVMLCAAAPMQLRSPRRFGSVAFISWFVWRSRWTRVFS
jgi:hypothetical protein